MLPATKPIIRPKLQLLTKKVQRSKLSEKHFPEDEQIQTNSESSKPDHHKEERSKPYNLRTLDLRDAKKKTNNETSHRIKKQIKTKATKKQKCQKTK